MKNKTVEQAVHDALWKLSSGLVGAGNVYENRPMTEVSYPFIDFQDFTTDFTGTKNGTTARVTGNVNIWDTDGNRQSVSNKASGLVTGAMATQLAYGYKTSLRAGDTTINIMQDRTVTPPVWRALVTLVFDI